MILARVTEVRGRGGPRFVGFKWLDAGQDGNQSLVDAAVAAATPVAESLVFHQVGPLTGDGPELVEPIGS